MSRSLVLLSAVVAAVGWASPAARAADEFGAVTHPALDLYELYDWPTEVVDLFSRVPVLDGGRVKPLSTFARFKLLKFYGGTRLRMPEGFEPKNRTATRFLLDCLFTPAVARRMRCFTVEDDQVLHAVGLRIEGRRKRDRYSYDELLPARAMLMSQANQFSKIEGKNQTPIQAQTLRLASGIIDFESLASCGDLGRHPVPTGDETAIRELFGDRDQVFFTEVLADAAPLMALTQKVLGSGPELEAPYRELFHHLDMLARGAYEIEFLPPASTHLQEWYSPGELYQAAFEGEQPVDTELKVLHDLEVMASLVKDATPETPRASITDEGEFLARAKDFQGELVSIAKQRGEYDKIPTEVSFYRGKFFFFNPWFFLFGFLLVSLAWMAPSRGGALVKAGSFVVSLSLILLTVGIVMRCIIRGRPPVSTLYETILFITAVGVFVCLIAEWINRRRIALGVAAFMGTIGMFLANKYELHEAVDTMPSLVAVLDTNFWLATHVTSVTIGYSAGLFAAALGHLYLLGRMFRLRGGDGEFYRTLSRMTYGLVCFGLLFSTVGTILGGIWANDSWGRFWGWDPKENGALLIVLSQLMILHARLGGYIREVGLAVTSVLSGCVVVFSWWGVNLLGVGLHSYGFTSGAALAVRWFYTFEVGFLALATAWWFFQGRGTGKAPAAPA